MFSLKTKEKQKNRSQRRKKNIEQIFFHLDFFIWKNLYFVRKHIWKNLVKTYISKIYILTFVLQCFLVAGYCKCSAPTPRKICTGFVDAVLRPKILGNRLDILTYILIAMAFHYITQKHLFECTFGLYHTSNYIYLLRNFFQTIYSCLYWGWEFC